MFQPLSGFVLLVFINLFIQTAKSSLKEQGSDTNGSTVCKSVFLKPTYITQLTEVTSPPLDDDPFQYHLY
jgi:hypothetical protein